jgi:hypothetical protein
LRHGGAGLDQPTGDGQTGQGGARHLSTWSRMKRTELRS